MNYTIVAPLSFLIWPVVTLYLLNVMGRSRGIIWSIFLGFLFLPAGFGYDLQLLPPVGKNNLPNIVLLIVLGGSLARGVRSARFSPLIALLAALTLLSYVFSSLTNMDPIVLPTRVMPGETPFDMVSRIGNFLLEAAPFIFGYLFLREVEDHRNIVRAMFIGGTIYSLFVLIEVRMSPQFSNWVYGFFPHSFLQHMRGGGWRPAVFQPHGIWLAFFMAMVTGAVTTMWRTESMRGIGGGTSEARANQLILFMVVYFLVVLVLCKSLASLLYGFVFVLLMTFFSMRAILFAALCLSALALLYPLLRYTGLFPTETITDLAYAYSYQRGGSLAFRFGQEADLLARAAERPLFGWGSFGRNRNFDEIFGFDISVTDGYWVIVFGTVGLFGFLGIFGLLTAPVLMMWRNRAKITSPATVGLALMLALNAIELLPNATITPWTWLIAGSLAGHAARLKVDSSEESSTVAPTLPQRRRTVI